MSVKNVTRNSRGPANSIVLLASGVLLTCVLSASRADGATIVLDPAGFTSGTDLSNAFDGVTLFRAEGKMIVFGDTATESLHLISDNTSPVYTNGSTFTHTSSGGSVWSAGQCCDRDEVLRADFDSPTASVSAQYIPFQNGDHDTGVLQIYDASDDLLEEAIFRSDQVFTLTLTNNSISYALASFSDTGKLGVITYTQIPEPSSMLLVILGLLGFGLHRKEKRA